MKNFINKLKVFLKTVSTVKLLVFIAVVITFILAICFSKTFSSILLIAVLIILFSVTNNDNMKDDSPVPQETYNILSEKTNKILYLLENRFNENKSFFKIIDYDKFQGRIIKMTNSAICVEFFAKSDIGKSTVLIDKMNQESEQVDYLVNKTIFGLLKQFVYNVDISRFVKVSTKYIQPTGDKSCYCVIRMTMATDLLNYFMIK